MPRFRILKRVQRATPGEYELVVEAGTVEARGAREAIEGVAIGNGSGSYIAVAERNWNEFPATVENEPKVTLGEQVAP